MNLIVDRTYADAQRADALARKGWAAMSEEEKAEWLGGLKGAYNAVDLNRVETAVGVLAETLMALPAEIKDYAESFGVAWDAFFELPYDPEHFAVETKTDWAMTDIPSAKELERYLLNVTTLRGALEYATDDLPSSMDGLTWSGANAIEKALVNLDAAISECRENRKDQIDRTAAVFVPSGVYCCGSVSYIKSEDSETAAVLFVPFGADSLVLADGATFYSFFGGVTNG